MRNVAAIWIFVAAALWLMAGCADDGAERQEIYSRPAALQRADAATEWFDFALTAVRDARLSPPVAARLFGYLGVAVYEAAVPGMPDYQSLAGRIGELPALPQSEPGAEYSWPLAVNSAAAVLLRSLFAHVPAVHAAIDSLEPAWSFRLSAGVSPQVRNRSADFGAAIGTAVYQWSQSDGYLTQSACSYTPPAGPEHWIPTPPAFAPPLLPCWGTQRLFVSANSEACAANAPPPYAEEPGSPFHAEAMEVYTTTSQLSAEQRAIAEFWADDPGQTGTPPGHSISILTQLIRARNASLETAAEAYARTGMALADAFIVCWRTKYMYNLLRPVTYIQRVIDADWTPLLNTPPFPECPSGHSVASGAAAHVLTELFGEFAFTDHTHDARGLAPRSFATFSEFAEEAAISRLYGGIHFRTAIEGGLEQGRCVGQNVSAVAMRR